MERVFQITAVILIGVAAYFLWRGDTDGTFVSAVFGAVAFLLSIRFQAKERLKQREIDEMRVEEDATRGNGDAETR